MLMRKFFGRHPFVYGLIKRGVRIVFTWNIVLLCIVGTVVGLGLFLGFIGTMAALGGGSGTTSNDSNLPAGVTYDTISGYGDAETTFSQYRRSTPRY